MPARNLASGRSLRANPTLASGRALATGRGVVPPFSPLDIPGLRLFARADAGLFQDTARTTPAVAQGDPVGGWYDSVSGLTLTQATSAACLKLRLDSANGRPSLAADYGGGGASYQGFTPPAGFSVDRRNSTLWAVLRMNSIGNDDYGIFNVGSGLTDFLIDSNGMSSAGPNRVRLFGTGASNGDTTARLYCDPMLVLVSCGASNATVVVDDQSFTSASAFGSGSVSGGSLFYRQDPGYPCKAEIHEFGVLDAPISAGYLALMRAYVYGRYRRAAATKQVVVQGDSLSEGVNTTFGKNWPCMAMDALPGGWRLWNQAITGTNAAVINTNKAESTVLYDGAMTKNVFVLWTGTNDLGVNAQSAAAVTTSLTSILTAMQSAGFYTIITTIINRDNSVNWDATKETNRLTVNTNLRGLVGGVANACLDLAADANFSSSANPYYAGDHLHLVQAGYDYIAGLAAGVIAAA